MSQNPKELLRRLQADWYQRLRSSGFKDIEDLRGNLKSYDRRTIAFENREEIADYFRRVEHYLQNHPDLRGDHLRILTLYSQGIFIKAIAKDVGKHRCTVMEIIKRYKKLI